MRDTTETLRESHSGVYVGRSVATMARARSNDEHVDDRHVVERAGGSCVLCAELEVRR